MWEWERFFPGVMGELARSEKTFSRFRQSGLDYSAKVKIDFHFFKEKR